MFNHHDISRNACMLRGPLAHHGYDWWWHSFTAQDADGEPTWMTAEIRKVTNYSHFSQNGQYYEGAFVLWKQDVLLNGTPIETEGGAVNYSDEELAALGIRVVWIDSDGQAAVIDYDSPNTHYFGGPARVGQYTVKVTQTIGNETRDISAPYSFTITPTWFFKFTDYSYLESGARYYLYSIMGEMDGQLYAMAMPGTDVVYKQAAIQVRPDEGGGIPLGYNRENIFMLTWDPHTVDGHYLYHLTTGTALDIFFAGVGSVSIQQVTAGEKAVRPEDPTQDGWWFGGWYADEALTARFDFDTAITADTDVYAKWVQPDFVLPEDLTSIEAEAFRGCAFTFVKLPDGIASIEAYAFADCPYLAYVEIPNLEVEIHQDAFGEAEGLTIYGPPRSPAAAFAAENGYTFVLMN